MPRGVGYADLSAVEVAREDHLKLARHQRLHRVGKVDEEDAEVGLAIGERPVRLTMTAWVAPGHLDRPASDARGSTDSCSSSTAALEVAQIGRPAERVARRGDVVVSEHGVRAVARAQPPELASRASERPGAG